MAAVASCAILLPASGLAQSRLQTIYRFAGGSDGAVPTGNLVADGQGVLYGTTNQGGESFQGTIYKLAPNADRTAWSHQVLYSFKGGTDGGGPQGGLAIDVDGSLYGTATSGGLRNGACENGCGTVFRLRPKADHTGWFFKVLYAFRGGTDGKEPRAAPVLDGGSLYGTTYGGGGPKQFGLVYQLTENAAGTAWNERVLHRFAGGLDGGNPDAQVTFLGQDLYGTTSREGIKTNGCSSDSRGCGTVFALARPASPSGAWANSVLYRFKGGADGMQPSGKLAFRLGKLYGTTALGGGANTGTVFQLEQTVDKSAWIKTRIYSYKAGQDGKSPQGVTVFKQGPDLPAILVGTTEFGGGSAGEGTVFGLLPNGSAWMEEVAHLFSGKTDGGLPQGPLLVTKPSQGGQALFGTTSEGGRASSSGTVFSFPTQQPMGPAAEARRGD